MFSSKFASTLSKALAARSAAEMTAVVATAAALATAVSNSNNSNNATESLSESEQPSQQASQQNATMTNANRSSHHRKKQQQQQQQQQQQIQTSLRTIQPLLSALAAGASMSSQSHTTHCEALLPQQPSKTTITRLARRRTIHKLHESSTRGATLESKYQVDLSAPPLGEGAFGSVHIARHRATQELVAIKKIPKQFTSDSNFQHEMEALLHIRQHGKHPNICGLRENFEEGPFYYLVLDLVSGGEMFDHLCQQGPYSEADAARLVREVASALAFCHGIGLVHGDLVRTVVVVILGDTVPF